MALLAEADADGAGGLHHLAVAIDGADDGAELGHRCPGTDVEYSRWSTCHARGYGLTVNCVLPVIPPDVALIVVTCDELTLLAAVNRPVLLIIPAALLLELHVAESVMSRIVPSDVVAIALYCCV